MKFLSVRSDICRQVPSDSTSRWTPLPLTMQFPLLGLARDFHPLDNAHAERTTKKVPDENIVRHFNIYLLLFLGKAMRDPEFVSLGGTYGQDFAFL